MKTVAIIQARMSSTRLPGKVLADLGGKPMLWHVVTRTQRAAKLDQVVVATSDAASDDAVAEFCTEASFSFFRGSEQDVLDRYYQTARAFEAETVVRLTADCPLLDAGIIDLLIGTFQGEPCDYTSNTINRSYPDGLDGEVFSRQALEKAWSEARLMSEREHVTPYIWKHPELFRLKHVMHSEDLSALRWTVDEPEDLDFIRAAYKHLGRLPDGMHEMLQLVRDYPELNEINRGFEVNEGYQKSLQEDKIIKSSEVL